MQKKQIYIDLLRKALDLELSDIFTYHKEAELFEQKLQEGSKIAELFREISKSELRHADIISVELIRQGEDAGPKLSTVDPSESIHESLESHLEHEASAIAIYHSLAGINKDAQFDIELKGIIANEKEHLKKINHILSNLK